MKIKPKSKYQFLENKFYKVIAINYSAPNQYLIQDDDLEFNWYDSSLFDQKTALNRESLIREQTNDYHYYLIPQHFQKTERSFKGKLTWNLPPVEFYEKYLFGKNLENNGFDLSNKLKDITSNIETQFSIIEQQVNSLSKTMRLLSDGYFPSIISISKINLNNTSCNEVEKLIRTYENAVRKLEYEVVETKDVYVSLEKIFQSSYNWTKGFAKFKNLFEEEYWRDQLNEIMNSTLRNVYLFSEIHNQISKEYFFTEGDGTEVKMIQFKTKEFVTTLKIRNIVH